MSETGFERLMNVVCVRLGYCGCVKDGEALHVTDFMPKHGSVTADQFADWVLLADGFNLDELSQAEREHREEIKAAFIEHMGREKLSAKHLRWGDSRGWRSSHPEE